MTSENPSTPVDQLSYEGARDELVATVRSLEGGGLTLEQSLELWERGEALAVRCQSWLDGAKEKLAAAQLEREAAAEGL